MLLRVSKILADTGKWSRREADELISMGKVTVNGRIAKPGEKADPTKDFIKALGKKVSVAAEKVVVALFKPRGILCNRPADQLLERGTVFDIIPRVKERVFPIGRLDSDAEGILLLTNDGELAQRLNKPKFEVPKTFLVKIDGHLDDKKIKRLQYGIKVEDFKTRPIQIEQVKSSPGKEWLRVTVTDTQNRIIRKVFENVGRPVDKVLRESFGPISIEGMVRGQYRYLSEKEINRLREFVGLASDTKRKKA